MLIAIINQSTLISNGDAVTDSVDHFLRISTHRP